MSFAQPFANYEILARVGAGAMGTVFKARQKHLNRIVALKVLKPGLARDARHAERLEREARTVARLNHPNIVTAYDLGHEGGYHYFVMEFVEGRSLRQLLAEWGAFPESQVLQVANQMASALAHAFECGVIHRDVKPANILIDGEGRAKLTDLGLARAETDLALTRDGATVGTPQYISPEQARNPHDADIRSDLYSLGATLFHMLTGQPPFKADAIGELITKVLHERPPSVIDLVPEISDGLSLIVRKLLAKDPGLRYQTPAELIADLQRIERRERPHVDLAPLDAETSPARSPRRRRQGAGVAWIALATATFGLVLGFVVGRMTSEGRPGDGREGIAESLLLLQPASARFARLAQIANGAHPPPVAEVEELRNRLLSDLDGQLGEELDAVTGRRKAETEAWFGAGGSWLGADAFIRDVVVARLDATTGFRPENIPDPRLRLRVTERLLALRDHLDELCVARDRALENGFERSMREEALPGALAVARSGRPDRAEVEFRAVCEARLGRLLPIPQARLEPALRQRIDEIQGKGVTDLAVEVGRIRGELAARGRERFEVLRERFTTVERDASSQAAAPSVLLAQLADVEREIEAVVPVREALRGDPRDPWPGIDEWLGTHRVELRARAALSVTRAFEQALDLAFDVLPDGGPEVAARALLGFDVADAEVGLRARRHLDWLRRAAALRDDLFRAILGDRDEVRFRIDGTRGPQDLVLARGRDGRLDLHRGDGRPVSFGALDVEALLRRPEVPVEVRERHDESTVLSRAVSLDLQGSPSSAVAMLDGSALILFRADCAPRLKTLPVDIDAAEAAARAAFAQIVALRDKDDALAVRDALARFGEEHAGSAILRGKAEYLRSLQAWAQQGAARAERRRDLRANLPASLRVEIGDDDVESVAGEFGNLPPESFTAGWSRDRGVAEFVPPDGPSGSSRAVHFRSPFGRSVMDQALDLEVRFASAGREPRAVMVEIGGVAAVVLVLPHGQVAAIVQPAAEVEWSALGARLAEPVTSAAHEPPRIVDGIWHRIRVVLRREGGAVVAAVELDGQDRVPLCRQVVPPAVEGEPSIAVRSSQSIALREFVVVHRRD